MVRAVDREDHTEAGGGGNGAENSSSAGTRSPVAIASRTRSSRTIVTPIPASARRMLMAGSVVLTLPIVIIFFATERLLTGGLTAGADKG